MITESPDREVLHKAVKHKADIVAIDEKETGLRATLKLRFTMLEGPENGVVLLEVHYFDLGFARGFSRLYCHHECLEVINGSCESWSFNSCVCCHAFLRR